MLLMTVLLSLSAIIGAHSEKSVVELLNSSWVTNIKGKITDRVIALKTEDRAIIDWLEEQQEDSLTDPVVRRVYQEMRPKNAKLVQQDLLDIVSKYTYNNLKKIYDKVYPPFYKTVLFRRATDFVKASALYAVVGYCLYKGYKVI